MKFIFNDDSYEIKLNKNDTKLDTETFEKVLNAMKEIKISQINREKESDIADSNNKKELEIAKLNCNKDETISNSNNNKEISIATLNCNKEVVIANSNNAKELYSNLNRSSYNFPQLPNNI